MVGEIEWNAAEEEGVAEDIGGGLEIRQRKKGKTGKENEGQVINGEQNSVYFEADEGEVDQSAVERNLQNGKANIGARDFNDHKNVPIEENGHVKIAISETGSSSYLSSEKKISNGIARKENEIQESGQLNLGNSSKVIVEEFDVERVIEQQETHDLFCPNCHSCITKRVILRKRKRLHGGSQSNLPPERDEYVAEANSPPSETADHEDKTAFTCLSCFTFFIPTDCGFNIFRIFGKRDGESNSLYSSEKIPAKKVSWVTSLFGSGSSKDKDSDAGVPLLAKSPDESGPVSSRDPSLGLKQKSPHVPTLGAADVGNKGSSTGMNNAGVPLLAESPDESGPISSRDPSLGLKQKSPHVPTLGAADVGNKGSSTGMNNAGVPLLAESTDESGPVSSRDPSLGLKQNSPHVPTLGAADVGNKGSSTRMNNADSSAGANQAQGDKESYPGRTVSEGNGTDKPDVMVKPPFLGGIVPDHEDTYSSMPPAAGDPAPDTGNNINIPTCPIPEMSAPVETLIDVGGQGIEESRRGNEWDVLKSIVYGGLMESIVSLSVVSSASGSGSSTLNICALGLANLIGGLFVMAHDLSELRSTHDTQSTNQRDEPTSRYYVKLGKRENFQRHVVVSFLAYIIFGLLPPVIYGFTFRKSDNKEYKLIAVAASSMLCVAVLAICKAHVKPQKDYIKSVLYYIGLALPASGLCYVAGVMIDRFFAEFGLFDQSTVSPSPPSSLEFIRFGSGAPAWASL